MVSLLITRSCVAPRQVASRRCGSGVCDRLQLLAEDLVDLGDAVLDQERGVVAGAVDVQAVIALAQLDHVPRAGDQGEALRGSATSLSTIASPVAALQRTIVATGGIDRGLAVGAICQ